jgi:hypothetical protein
VAQKPYIMENKKKNLENLANEKVDGEKIKGGMSGHFNPHDPVHSMGPEGNLPDGALPDGHLPHENLPTEQHPIGSPHNAGGGPMDAGPTGPRRP